MVHRRQRHRRGREEATDRSRQGDGRRQPDGERVCRPLDREPEAGARGDQLALDAAYLDTVAPEQREAQKRARLFFSPVLAGAAGLAPLGHTLGTPAGRAYREGREAFARAAPLDEKEFWASKKIEDGQTLHQAMLAEARRIFAGTLEAAPTMERDRVRFLLSTTRDGRTLLGVPYRVLLPTAEGKPNFRLEAEVVVEGPLDAAPPPLGALPSTRCA